MLTPENAGPVTLLIGVHQRPESKHKNSELAGVDAIMIAQSTTGEA